MSDTIFLKDASNQIKCISYHRLAEAMQPEYPIFFVGIEISAGETPQHYLYTSNFSGFGVVRRYPLVSNLSGNYVCANVYACLSVHANSNGFAFSELRQSSFTPILSDKENKQVFTTKEISSICRYPMKKRAVAQCNQISQDQSQMMFQQLEQMNMRLALIEQHTEPRNKLPLPVAAAPSHEGVIRTFLRNADSYANGLATAVSSISTRLGFFSSPNSNNQAQKLEMPDDGDLFSLEEVLDVLSR